MSLSDKMVSSIQFLIAALTVLAPDVRADVGCINLQRPLPYYTSHQGGCCSLDFAVAKRDDKGQVLNVQCGDTPNTCETLEGVAACFRQPGEPQCPDGLRASIESFQQGRCGVEPGAPASGYPPNNNVGCYSGRIYVNRGECCSTDYVVAEGDGFRCGDKLGTLAADSERPEHLKDVPACNGTIDKNWCPRGVHASEWAINRGDVCTINRGDVYTDTGCCQEMYSRDKDGVCQPYIEGSGSYAELFAARKADGCELPKRSCRCCPNRKHFRNANGECSEFTAGGEKKRAFNVWRTRNEIGKGDGCTDYLKPEDVRDETP
ncbi:hypothetical protein HRG_014858 [Hirsutella rhossiliensis]